jgi:hypothetical protein
VCDDGRVVGGEDLVIMVVLAYPVRDQRLHGLG